MNNKVLALSVGCFEFVVMEREGINMEKSEVRQELNRRNDAPFKAEIYRQLWSSQQVS